MNLMIDEGHVTFKDIEKEIFRWTCEIAREATKEVLESYDRKLMQERDKSIYRNKGKKQTVIKTVYGEVNYERTIYQVEGTGGYKYMTYLLDESLDLGTVGFVSMNLVEMMTKGITEASYRECARQISDTTGQSISAMGVWNIIQAIGEQVIEDEKNLVKKSHRGLLKGKRETKVLFEEADGVWIGLQGKDRKESKNGDAEIKVAIAYDGWKKEGKKRYSLDGKIAVAGFAGTKDFTALKDAAIAETYDTEKIEKRILNGDGADWIKNTAAAGTVIQLDPFHRNQAVKRYIHDKKAEKEIMRLLCSNQHEEMFRYLEMYKDSITNRKDTEDAEKLISYFRNNEDGLRNYKNRIEELPESPEGIEYRNLGTMENHIWSIVARRMKHRHASWSKSGANHLVKLIAKKTSGRLKEVTDRYKQFVVDGEKIQEIEISLSSNKTPGIVGKGYEYPINGHMYVLGTPRKGTTRTMLEIAGY